jgi:hypothetical protein
LKVARAALIAAAALAGGCKSSRRATSVEPKPLRAAAASDKTTIPALEARDDEGLTFPIEAARTADPAGRRLRLLLGGGEATLTLLDPGNGKGDDVAFGRGELAATDPKRGGPVVAAIGRWLGQAPPAAPEAPGALKPFPITYARLGTQDGWECDKLFFEEGASEAELFLNVRLDGKQARLVEKDEEYRKPLLALLATALRDGTPPRRTSGPELAGASPLVASLAPIAGAAGASEPEIWAGTSWLARVEGGGTERVLVWTDLAKPPRVLAEVEGAINRIVPSPRGDRVALLVLHPSQPRTLSSEDPGDVVLVPIGGGAARPLVTSGADFVVGMMSQPVWAPDGAALAVDGRAPGKPPRPTLTRVYDAASGRLLASTPSATPGPAPKRWDRDGLILRTWAKDGEQTLRWLPGKSAPAAEHRAAATPLRSPDGRYVVAFRGAGVDISGPGGRRRFDARSAGDRAAVDALHDDPELTAWLGGGALVLQSDAPVALDLATAKLRYLFPDGDFQFLSASADGGRVIARDRERRLLWGAVAR